MSQRMVDWLKFIFSGLTRKMQERQGACVFPDGSVHTRTRPKENVNATKYFAVFQNGVSKINQVM